MSRPLTILQGTQHAPISPLHGKTVAVIGFGNQGHAHALNLRDSGVNVIVGNRADTASGHRAREYGFDPLPIDQATSHADLVIIALPDEVQPRLFRELIAPHLKHDGVVGFLHGFCVRFKLIEFPENTGVIMVAPKGPGKTLRDRFVQGLGIPCLFALHQDNAGKTAQALGLAWANAIGCARAAIIVTTFQDETDTDLFGEQTVLCGGLTSLVLAAFETLVNAGYPPELAYLECCHEVKQIADLVYDHGLSGMMQAISNTAEFGAYHAGPMLIDDHVRTRMKECLQNVMNGDFARMFLADSKTGSGKFETWRRELRDHRIEKAGEVIRGLMPQTRQEDIRT